MKLQSLGYDMDLHQGHPDNHKNTHKSTVPSRQGNLTKKGRLCCTFVLMTTPEILLISNVSPMLETGSGLDNQVLLLSRQFCAAAAGPSLGQPMGPGIG